jgi:hypothetical protein
MTRSAEVDGKAPKQKAVIGRDLHLWFEAAVVVEG